MLCEHISRAPLFSLEGRDLLSLDIWKLKIVMTILFDTRRYHRLELMCATFLLRRDIFVSARTVSGGAFRRICSSYGIRTYQLTKYQSTYMPARVLWYVGGPDRSLTISKTPRRETNCLHFSTMMCLCRRQLWRLLVLLVWSNSSQDNTCAMRLDGLEEFIT